MGAKNVISVFEHERLTIHGDKRFSKDHLKSLIKVNEDGGSKYFTLIRDGVKFSQYVGVIQAGNLTIEILPKADANAVIDESLKPAWREVLLEMLRECSLLKVDHVDKANLKMRSNSILDIYLELFLAEVEMLHRNGLVKKYRKCEGNITALKGRLDFAKNLTHNMVHKERFYAHYTEYSHENLYNQILLEAVKIIPKISVNPWFADRVNRIILNFPEMPTLKVTAGTFAKLNFDRKTESYREALLISKMLILNFRPDISGGSENVIAILFDMNKLWEEFVYRRLKKEEVAANIHVSRQSSSKFWKPLGKDSKTVRPDIVIEKDGRKIVVDTKWKVLKDMMPSDEDLKQMFIYNLFWECDKSYLLYPANETASGYGEYHSHFDVKEFQNKCGIEKISILENSKLKPRLGREILLSLNLMTEK